MISAIIQAKMGSHRLPEKAIKKIKLFDPVIEKKEKIAVNRILESKFWASGAGIGEVSKFWASGVGIGEVSKFENEFKKYK